MTGMGGNKKTWSVHLTEKALTQELRGSKNLEMKLGNLKFRREAKQSTLRGKERELHEASKAS